MKGKSYNDYTSEFELYENESGLATKALLMFYKQGLPDALRDKLSTHETLPVTLQQWNEHACKADHVYREQEEKRSVLRKVSNLNPSPLLFRLKPPLRQLRIMIIAIIPG